MSVETEEADDDEIEMDLDDDDTDEADEGGVIDRVGKQPETERMLMPDDAPAVGSWWWIKDKGDAWKPKDYDEPGKKWIACVVEVGSNYAKLRGARFSLRLALDDFPKRCKLEPNPTDYIDKKVGFHKTEVRKLMAEIQRVCHQLGVPMSYALAAAESPSTALALAHGTEDIKSYKKALVKLKDKTLPDLFSEVKEQHEEMAKWMKVELIPAQAELTKAQEVTSVINDKIGTVELYAGLTEELVCVREGDVAPVDTKVHLMQRRHYMDEECLVRYEAGGMSFKDIKAFDKWLARDENMFRILPHDRTIIAFKIRRWSRDTSGMNLSQFISFHFYEKRQDQRTFLYIRNGHQLWRLETDIDFEAELFPNREDSELLGDNELWVKHSEYDIEHGTGIITGRVRNSRIDSHRGCRKYMAHVLWQWHRAGCPGRDENVKPRPRANPNPPDVKWQYIAIDNEHEQGGWTNGKWGKWQPGSTHEIEGDPRQWPFGFAKDEDRHAHRDPVVGYYQLVPENIFYDDVMKRIRRAAFEHNRIAVIVQGLLDRSTCLHPHPPWRIWTPEGFAQALILVYDVSKALTPGEEPDWKGYREQLNKSIKPGVFTIGQQRAWGAHMEKTHGEKWQHYIGYSNKGPGTIARVARMKRNGDCEFRWTRERARPKWVSNPKRPGYLMPTYPEINVKWVCPASELTCISAYTPGDFHIFYDDPRTRANYIKWAGILLSAENWHHNRREKGLGNEDKIDPDDGFDDSEEDE